MTTEAEQTPAAEQAVEDNDAAAIWAEIEAEFQAKIDEVSPSDEGHTDADLPAEPSEPEPVEQPQGDEPKAETTEGSEGSGFAPAPAANEPAPQPDPWANAPKELRDEYERIQHQARTLELQVNRERGRTSALTKKLNEIAPPPAPKKEPAARQADIERLKEEYPEVATPLLQELDDLRQTLGSLTQAEQERRAQLVEVQANDLRKVHPDYGDVIGKHADTFDAWVKDPRHPRWVLEAFERNREDIVNAREVIPIVTEFKKFLRLPVPGAKQPPASPAAAQTPGTPQPALSDRRQRQLEGSITPTSVRTQPGGSSAIPEEGDQQAIWDAIEREEQKRAR